MGVVENVCGDSLLVLEIDIRFLGSVIVQPVSEKWLSEVGIVEKVGGGGRRKEGGRSWDGRSKTERWKGLHAKPTRRSSLDYSK